MADAKVWGSKKEKEKRKEEKEKMELRSPHDTETDIDVGDDRVVAEAPRATAVVGTEGPRAAA